LGIDVDAEIVVGEVDVDVSAEMMGTAAEGGGGGGKAVGACGDSVSLMRTSRVGVQRRGDSTVGQRSVIASLSILRAARRVSLNRKSLLLE